tara:strand:- start:52 stop:324 length:273 start_codon:yes stop_codon:yes gene_type:complete
MDQRREKYYNYVIDDLVKKTEMDYEREKIIFPFNIHLLFGFQSTIFINPNRINTFDFKNYIVKTYGVHDEEVEDIWELYKERMLILINNG